jgi:homoserine O-acetyltransferase
MAREVPTIKEGASIEEAARLIMEKEATHLPIVSQDATLVGIVTAWDISKAVAMKLRKLDEIMTRNVITTRLDETIQQAAERMEAHRISALPVIDDQNKVG